MLRNHLTNSTAEPNFLLVLQLLHGRPVYFSLLSHLVLKSIRQGRVFSSRITITCVQPFPWSGWSHDFVLRRSGLILIVGAKRRCAGGLIISMPSGYAPLTVVMLPNIFPAL
jgi:hypothetical protein